MNLHTTCAATAALLLSLTAAAQDQATTLLSLARRADVVVRATVTQTLQPTPQWLQLTLRADEVLKGAASATFLLTEPAGQCCGRSLFALQVGDERLLFLKRTGPTLHTLGGGRGVMPATADVVAHTQALLLAGDASDLARLLAQQLDSAEPRIAHDAAAALASLPDLSLARRERGQVVASLYAAVQRGSTNAAALAEVAARVGDAQMVDAVLPLYMGARRDDHADLLRRALTRCSPGLVAERMPIFVGATRQRNLRAAKLLQELPPRLAQAAMTDLLSRSGHPQVKLHLCEGLLAAGVSEAALRPLVPAVVLRVATARRQQRPTFRNIDPRR
jgi:hypothetical protein